MGVRVSENQNLLLLTNNTRKARQEIVQYSDEISTGLKVDTPGDTTVAGIISQFRDGLKAIDGSVSRAANAKAFLNFQEDSLQQVSDVMVRAKEIAAQGATEIMDQNLRATMSNEVFALRDQLVQIANSTYQGKYVWGGLDDDDPPYDLATYTNPATGSASQRYVFDNGTAETTTRAVTLTDTISVTITSNAGNIFTDAIGALERLGRSLAGYQTGPASGTPDGTGTAYTFPADFTLQTSDIRAALDLVDTARVQRVETERASVGARTRRIETAESVLNVAKQTSTEALDGLQNADIAESATNLSKAQAALEASYTVTSRVLKLSILDYR